MGVRRLIVFLLFFTLVGVAGAADWVSWMDDPAGERLTYVSYAAPPERVIEEVRFVADSANHVVLDLETVEGDYAVEIWINHSYGWFYKTIYVEATYPNGSVLNATHTDVSLYPGATVRVQGMGTDLVVEVGADIQAITEVAIFFKPVLIVKNVFLMEEKPEPIMIKSFELSSDEPLSRVKAKVVTIEEFQEDWRKFKEGIGKTVWNAFLGAVSQIPVVGEYIASVFDFLALFLSEFFWWVRLIFFEHILITFLLVEMFILMYAASRSGSVMAFWRRYVSAHVRLVELMYEFVLGVIRLITSVISAVGSLIPFT